MKCSKCGAEVKDNLNFCSNCGAKLNKFNFKFLNDFKKYVKNDGENLVINKRVLLAIIVVVLFVFMIILAFTSGGGSTTGVASSNNSSYSSTPPITVENCVAIENTEKNRTKFSITGTATRDFGTDDELIYGNDAAITTEDGEVIRGSGLAVEMGVIHKGEPIHFNIESHEKLNSKPEKITFKVIALDKHWDGIDCGSVSTNVTSIE